MKTIKYKLADGRITEVEVTDEVAEVYEQILAYEKKVNRKETRRHISLNLMREAGFDFADDYTDIETSIEREANYAAEMKRDAAEFDAQEKQLKKQRTKLNGKLTPRQAQAYFEFIYLKLKKVEIEKNMGITEGAVRKLILKAEDNLDKLHFNKEAEEIEKLKYRKKYFVAIRAKENCRKQTVEQRRKRSAQLASFAGAFR